MRPAKLVIATAADKKNVGGVRRFVLPVGIGDATIVEDVTLEELEAAAKFMLARAFDLRGFPEGHADENEQAVAPEPIVIASGQ